LVKLQRIYRNQPRTHFTSLKTAEVGSERAAANSTTATRTQQCWRRHGSNATFTGWRQWQSSPATTRRLAAAGPRRATRESRRALPMRAICRRGRASPSGLSWTASRRHASATARLRWRPARCSDHDSGAVTTVGMLVIREETTKEKHAGQRNERRGEERTGLAHLYSR
jgi:hypothetical protein